MSLILASQSKARQDMLRAAGLTFESRPAGLDEKSITQTQLNAGKPPIEIARALAREKALYIAKQCPDALVIGSDQILECEGQMLSKAINQQAAKEKLEFLRGKTHHLISAVCVVKNEEVLWNDSQAASLTMHNFDDQFLQAYIEEAGLALTRSVGAYELESLGVQLFKTIEGDYFTILGMPLLSLLTYLKTDQGVGL